MKQNWKKGWLVMAAALMMGMTTSMTSCSSDDALTEPAVPAATATAHKVHVSVGAGLDGNQTRSTVTTEGGSRSLSFTAGDRIYVRAVISTDNSYPEYGEFDSEIMAGYLDIDASSISGTNATFSGDLTVYQKTVDQIFDTHWVDEEGHTEQHENVIGQDDDGNDIIEYIDEWIVDMEGHWETDDIPTYNVSANEIDYVFSTDEPLSECISVSAQLVHSGTDSKFSVNDDINSNAYLHGSYNCEMASSVEKLMTSYLDVRADSYDAVKHGFNFTSNSPIVNCAVSGLTAGATYEVTYESQFTTQLGEVTANGDGNALFAFFGSNATNQYHGLRFKKKDVSEWEYLNLGQKTLTNKVYNVTKSVAKEPLATPITFQALADGTTVTFNPAKEAIKIQYSKNDGAWADYSAPITLKAGDKVAFRGNNETYFDAGEGPSSFSCSADCYLYGNIMSLVTDYTTDEFAFASAKTLTGPRTFMGLFIMNEHVKNHPSKAILLPATTLTDYCYYATFYGCAGLKTAPGLPATTLAEGCYYYMFANCAGLETAPELPATTLAEDCYTRMFEGCTSLTSAPELPATTLAEACYSYMFLGCTSLTSAPELPATTLVDGCYGGMFQGCTSLTSAPELPATTMTKNCYAEMFLDCTSLKTAPELPATTLAFGCYSRLFMNCTSLTSAPELPVKTLATDCYWAMFAGCTSLKTAPVLPAPTLVQGCYRVMFQGCTQLESVTCLATEITAKECTSNWLKDVPTTGTFTKAAGMTSWTEDASGIPSGWTVVSITPTE